VNFSRLQIKNILTPNARHTADLSSKFTNIEVKICYIFELKNWKYRDIILLLEYQRRLVRPTRKNPDIKGVY
jgi:hypothetical protein